MRRTKSGIEGVFGGILVLIAIVFAGIIKFFEFLGPFGIIALIISFIGLTYLLMKRNEQKRQKKIAYLREKYQDEELVNKILKGFFWQGQTADQLRDSLGNPVEKDRKILKTKKKEIWKYDHRGSNRFGLRITLENNIVVAWDKKS